MNSKGFSMLEMVLVLILVAIITVSAAPEIITLFYNAIDQSRDYEVQAIQSGITFKYAEDMMDDPTSGYPGTLDSASNTDCHPSTNPCFTNININLEDFNGTSGAACDWIKNSDSEYDCDTGPTTFTYTYNSSTGKFTQTGEVSNL